MTRGTSYPYTTKHAKITGEGSEASAKLNLLCAMQVHLLVQRSAPLLLDCVRASVHAAASSTSQCTLTDMCVVLQYLQQNAIDQDFA